MRPILLILLAFPLLAHSEPIKEITANVPADRPAKSCRQTAQADRLESIFLQIQESNLAIFESAQLSREDVCLNLGSANKDRPAAYANSQSGEITFSENFLGPDVSDEILAGVMAHEIAHILLHHNNSGNLPFEIRKSLPASELESARTYFSLQKELINERFYRGTLFDPYSSFDIGTLEAEEPEFVSLALELLPSPLFLKEGRFFAEPHLVDEAKYSEVFDLAE